MTRHNFPPHWAAAQVLEADGSEDGWEWGVGCVTSGLAVIQLFAWCVCFLQENGKEIFPMLSPHFSDAQICFGNDQLHDKNKLIKNIVFDFFHSFLVQSWLFCVYDLQCHLVVGV